MASRSSRPTPVRTTGSKTQNQKSRQATIPATVREATVTDALSEFVQLSSTEQQSVLKQVTKSLKVVINTKPSPNDDLNRRILDVLTRGDDKSTSNASLGNEIDNSIVQLINDWPQHQDRCHVFLNHALPPSVRWIIWYLHLSNGIYRQKFLNDLSDHPPSILSPMDTEVRSHCDRLIGSLSLASNERQLLENTKAMKAVLSYYRSLFPDQHDLTETEYYYAIPIIFALNPIFTKSTMAFDKSLSILVEMYRSWFDRMPSILNNGVDGLDVLLRRTEFHLQEMDPPVYQHLQKLLPSSSLSSRSVTIELSSTRKESPVFTLLRKCCSSWFENMFADCLSTETLSFLWDQYFITSDVPDFAEELLSFAAAAAMIILRDFLFQCHEASDVESTLKIRTRNVTLSQFQSTMQRFSSKKLREIIDRDRVSVSRTFSNHDRFESQFLPDNPPNTEDSSIYPLQGLLHRLVQACNRVAHSQGNAGRVLNEQTIENWNLYRFDLRMAEAEVFRSKSNRMDWEQLSTEQKEAYRQQGVAVTKRRVRDRYAKSRFYRQE